MKKPSLNSIPPNSCLSTYSKNALKGYQCHDRRALSDLSDLLLPVRCFPQPYMVAFRTTPVASWVSSVGISSGLFPLR
jgi:hypothetical protein